MTLQFHPKRGTILECNFSGYIMPEIDKKRTVVVISPQLDDRAKLCTVVPLSLTKPNVIKDYHLEIFFNPQLPYPYESESKWLKGDLIYSVSFSRLNLLRTGFDASGKRTYDKRILDEAIMQQVEHCIMCGLGIKH